MRILFLAHFYPPEIGGAAARLHGLARWLAHYGHEVTVITGFPNYPSGVIPPAYRGKLRTRETMDGVEVVRTWVYASAHNSSVRRLANYFSFVASALLTGVLSRRAYDVVVASSPPLFLGLAGWALAKLKRMPFVFDLRDLWPDVAVDAGAFAEDSRMTRLGRKLAAFLYRRADHLTPVTWAKRERLLSQGVPEAKMSVVPNGVDLDEMVPARQSDVRAQIHVDGEFLLLYAGLIGIAQGVEVAAEAASRLRDEHVHFLIVGDGVRREYLEQRVAELNLSNVTLLPRQPREKIPEFMAAADACLVPLASTGLKDAVPSKLLEAWAYERPVILAADGEAAELVHASGGGLVVKPGNANRLAHAVKQMAANTQWRRERGRKGHAYVAAHFDRPQLARAMEAVLARVVEEHQGR